MKIHILGHLQNTSCHEKKTNCYCIFELTGLRSNRLLTWTRSGNRTMKKQCRIMTTRLVLVMDVQSNQL